MFKLVIIIVARFMSEDSSTDILLPSRGRFGYSVYTARSSPQVGVLKGVKCGFHFYESGNK